MLPLVAAALIAGQSGDSAPPRPITQLIHTTWTSKEGAPIGIRELAQTRDGYLWLGTYFGLFRFDGVRFVRYVPLSGGIIPNESIGPFVASPDGSLWFVRKNGAVSRLRADSLSTWDTTSTFSGVEDLTESSKGVVVGGGAGGIYRFADGKWENVSAAWGYPGKQCVAVWYDRDDALWAVTEDRVVYLPAGGHRFLDPGIPVRSPSPGMQFGQEADGTIWFLDFGQSVTPVQKLGETARPRSELTADPLAMLLDSKGSLWVASGRDGLYRVLDPHRFRDRLAGSPRAVEHFSMKDGLLTDIPVALLEDREGNVWVGSSSGLERFREGAFTPFPAIAPGRPRFVMAGRDSMVWTNPFNDGSLQRFGPRGQDTLDPGFRLATIAQDSSGQSLFVDGDTRILRLEGRRFVPIPLRGSLAHGLYTVGIDPTGTIWAYSVESGLLRVVGDSLVQIARLDGPTIPHGQVFIDSKGRVWVAQPSRVALYTGGKLTTFEASRGISGFVYAFFEDRSGVIWAATAGGLSKFTGERFQTLTQKQGIPEGLVYGSAQDQAGAWWLATKPGIVRYPPGEIERALTDSTYSANYRIFDESDGMVGALVKGYWGPVLTRSGDGKIWVATDSGLARIDPQRVPAASPPPVRIEVARFQNREQGIAEGDQLPAGTRDLEIDYTSLTFAKPERVQFRYQLEGADTAWRDVGTRRRAYYTGLEPRSYRFRVSASMGDGVWTEAEAAWSFRVLPRWYQTLWFKGLVVLLIGAIGAVLAALIQRSRHHRAQQALKDKYDATLAERARIAQDLHDTLLQGFAGVTLQLKAAELALPQNPQGAADTILRVQRLAHESLKEARERVWEMRDTDLGRDDLPAALETMARERIGAARIELAMMVSGARRRLTRALEDAAFRIGREAIANAVRHAGASRIEVRLGFEPNRLQLQVRDNGRGFSPDIGENARRNGHFGLSGMVDRAAHLGGRCEVTSPPEGGTLVSADLPLK